jgi:hypothetical protein
MATSLNTDRTVQAMDTWAEFKKYLDGTYFSGAFAYEEDTAVYRIVTEPLAGIRRELHIVKNGNPDQIEFETSYKGLAPRLGVSWPAKQGEAGSHAQRWMFGLSDGTAFISPALEHVTAVSPHAVRLTDGTAFYKAPVGTQLPAALVGGRLDSNLGSWLGSIAPTVGQKNSANSIPVVLATDQSVLTVTGSVSVGGSVSITGDPAEGKVNTAPPDQAMQIGGPDAGGTFRASYQYDLSTGNQKEYALGVSLRVDNGAGASEAFGTAAFPVFVAQGSEGTHAQRWMVGLSDGVAFINPATDRTTASAPFSVRLSDGSAFYSAPVATQLPSALVGGRLDSNIGSWLGSTAPTVGQKTSANSIPVVLASDQGILPVSALGDTTATGALGVLNAAVTLALAGFGGAGFQLAAGTLIGTLVAEVSYDAGTTWVATFFADPSTSARAPTLVFATANTATGRSLVIPDGATHVRVRVSAFGSGTANGTVKATVNSVPVVTPVQVQHSGKATYATVIRNFVPISNATDMITISGSASRTIRVTRGILTATQTTAGTNEFFVIKRSTANSGGTSAAATVVPYDRLNPAASAAVVTYSANPVTLGTTVGNVTVPKVLCPTTTSLADRDTVFDFTLGGLTQGIVLRGTGDVLALSFNGVSIPSGLNINFTLEWVEELHGTVHLYPAEVR